MDKIRWSPENIRKLRGKLGLSQEQFAARLSDHLMGCSVSRWESGEHTPSLYYSKRLDALASGGEWWRFGKGERPPWGRPGRREPRYPYKRTTRRKG